MRDYLPPAIKAERLRQMQAFAAARGGRCLSSEYVHCKVLLLFHCAIHGSFSAQPRHISDGVWCRKCRDDARKPPVIERLRQYVQERGGKIKTEYVTARQHITIDCPIHGEWQTTPDNLLNKKSWCPRCARGKPRTRAKKQNRSDL